MLKSIFLSFIPLFVAVDAIGVLPIFVSLSSRLMGFWGEAGSKALSKVTSLLLAAIAVMLIRKGLEQLMTL